jgi:uridine phosphorylase
VTPKKTSTAPRPRAAPRKPPARKPSEISRIEPSQLPSKFALPERIYYAYPSILFHALQETLGASDITPTRFGLVGRALVKSRGDEKVGLVRGALGASAAAVILDEAIAAGAKEVIIFGSAVAVSPLVTVGSLVVPSEAVSGEGASGFYLPRGSKRAPDGVLRETLTRLLETAPLPFRVGRVMTSDGFYRQVPARLQGYRKARLLAFDMELAALFAAARYRGIRAAALLVVTGSIANDTFEQGSDRAIVLGAIVSSARCLAGWSLKRPE